MAGLSKLRARTNYVDEVYQVLLDAISEGRLAPGERITQEDIAEQLSVSRSPVLQALGLLKKDGLVQDAPGRGLQVAPLDATWTCKIYEVRGALDALAAKLAAARGFKVDPRLLADGRKATRSGDVKAMIDADIAFHRAIYVAADNPLLLDTVELHWAHLRRVMGAALQSAGQRSTIWDEHQAIADALASGDGEQAAKLAELHIQDARAGVIKRMGWQLPD